MTKEQLRELEKDLVKTGLENVQNIVLIKNGATNGQVIRALFNPNHVERTDDGVIVENYDFDKEWWNSPYK